jgi:hypothetical protein
VRTLRSLSLLAVLVPGLLAAPALDAARAQEAAPVAVSPEVQELSVSGVDRAAAQTGSPSGVTGALVSGDSRDTVLLTGLLDAQPFSVVGVTWDHDPALGVVEAFVRTRTDGSWSGWQALGGAADEEPDEGTPDTTTSRRGGTSPLWVDRADGVQARVDVLSGPAPRGLRLSLVDPGTSEQDLRVTASLTSGTSGAPAVRSRKDWGADESIRRGSPSYASGIHAVTVHHTASSNDYAAADVPRLIRGFYAYHVKSNGWSDLGYNFLVDRFGRVWEGRAGGTSKPVIGSHAGGFNTGTVGISIIGTYDAVAPSAAAVEAVAAVAGWRLGLAGKDPASSVTVRSGGSTRYAAGTSVSLPRVFGHRQVSTTACPGDLGMAALPRIRERAKALAAGAAPAPVTPSPLEVVVPASVARGATVPVVVQGTPGATVQLWFSKRDQPGATSRREGVLDASGAFRTSYVADDLYTLFAVAGAESSPRRSVAVSPAVAGPSGATGTGIRVRGPVTVEKGGRVLVTATGPAGADVAVWSRPTGSGAFARTATGRFDAAGAFTTSWTAEVARDYFAVSGTNASADARTLLGPVPNGLDVAAPAQVAPGAVVPLVVQASPGAAVELWAARRGAPPTRRWEGTAAADGTFRAQYRADDEHTVFAVVGDRTSTRVTTRLTTLPADPPAAPPGLVVEVPPAVDAGTGVPVVVRGTPGSPVAVWFRRRDADVWTRLREGVLDAEGRWATSYVGTDDHELFATSGATASPDAGTLVVPVLTGPRSAALGSSVQLTGRARPGDAVVVESRRRGATAFSRTTLKAGADGAFRTPLAVDDEYEYRPLAESRTGTLRRLTVAPTTTGGGKAAPGEPVSVGGTARPGATVDVVLRRSRSLLDTGRRARVGTWAVGATATAGPDGRWSAVLPAVRGLRWYARSDGNATGVQRISLTSPVTAVP